MRLNRRIVLARRARGIPQDDDFHLEEVPAEEPGDGEVLVRHSHIGLAPAGWIRMSEETGGYPLRTEVGSAIYSAAVGEVVVSHDPELPVGTTTISIDGGWQSYAIGDRSSLTAVDTSRAAAPVWLGLLGISGFTAYAALRWAGAAKVGDVIVVSSAAGAVGSAAVQFAKGWGCRVIGIAGGPEKCHFVTEKLGADECLDYTSPQFADRLALACPAGVDLYLDNVGGPVRDAVWPLMAPGGAVMVCGQINEYSTAADSGGPNWYPIMAKTLRLQGINWSQYWDRYPEFVAAVLPALEAGTVRPLEHLVSGLENAPAAFRGLLEGKYLGKVVVEL